MYKPQEIITIFNNCRNVAEIMKAASLLKDFSFKYCKLYLAFIQMRSLIRINHIHDDGN